MPGESSNTNDPVEDDAIQVATRYTNMSPEELMKGCTIPIDFMRICPQWWDVDVTPRSNEDHMTTYMGEQLKAYQPADLWDEELLGAFQWQFEGWTEDMFKKVHHTYLQEMKKLLRTRGINTGPINVDVEAQLTKLLEHDPDVLPEYTEEYLTKTVFHRRSEAYKASLNFRRNTRTLGRDIEDRTKAAGLGTTPSSYSITVEERARQQPTPSEVRVTESNKKLEEESRSRAIYQNSVSRLPSQEPVHSGQDLDSGSALVPEQNLYHGATPRVYPALEEQFKIATLVSDERVPYKKLLPDDAKNEMIDPGAANIPTVGKDQSAALQQEYPGVTFDAKTTGKSSAISAKGTITTNEGTATVRTAIGAIKFKVVEVSTPFLLCLNDMNKYKGKPQLQITVLYARRGIPELKLVFIKPARWCKALFADLRRTIATYLDHMPHMSRAPLEVSGTKETEQCSQSRRIDF